jgi:hypothetical protein
MSFLKIPELSGLLEDLIMVRPARFLTSRAFAATAEMVRGERELLR